LAGLVGLHHISRGDAV
jgi:hypothetical protein